MDFCELIAKDNHLNQNDIKISLLIVLLHDYARFEQWTKFKTYDDTRSFDHGDLALIRLFEDNEIQNYCTNKDYYDLIYDAIKYHNKYNYPENLNDKNKLFCKIIRDADKLDIFYLLGVNKNLIKEDEQDISENVKQTFYNHNHIKHSQRQSKSDDVILKLAMIFDLNFTYSFKYIKQYNIIDKIFENIKNKYKFKPYFDYIKTYIEERTR